MFLDIASGICIAIGLQHFFGLPLGFSVIAACIVFALLPDSDFIVHLARGGTSKNAAHHRDLLHYPLVYIPLGMLLISLLSIPLAIAFGVSSLLHFLHDSIGIGWGVQWLYPFTASHYSFLYLYQAKGKTSLPKRYFYSWKHEDIPAINKQYGDPDWIKHIYLNWHPYAIIEFAAFLAAVAALLVALK